MFDEAGSWTAAGGSASAAPRLGHGRDRALAGPRPVTVGRRVEGLDLVPGPALIAVLEAVDLAEVDDFTVVEVVAAWRRVGAWVASRAAAAAGVLAARESMNPQWPAGVGAGVGGATGGVAGEELALRLACSRRAAKDLVAAGVGFEGALAPTGAALERGLIDEAKARVLVSALGGVPVEAALDVQDLVLDAAPRRTPRQLAVDVERALVAVDPHAAGDRSWHAVARRCVGRPRVLPDGMAGLWARLPAPAAVAVNARLDQLARAVRAAGDGRTVEQLRADVLCASILNPGRRPVVPDIDEPGTAGGAPGDGSSAGGPPALPEHLQSLLDWVTGTPVRTEIRITVPITTLMGTTCTLDHPPELDDVRGPASNPEGPTRDDVGPGGPRPGDPLAGQSLVGPSPPGQSPSDQSPPDQSPPDQSPPDQASTSPPPRVAGPRLHADAPPELAGYGPIAPWVAQAHARNGTWRRLVTDPLSGALLDVGRTRYRPPADLAEFVRLRDVTCVRPGCSTPAEACDLDHTTAFGDRDEPGGGTTSHANLSAACRTDHNLKTHAGYRLTQAAPGTFIWTTPTGHTYTHTSPGAGDPPAEPRPVRSPRRSLGDPPF